MKIKVNKVTCSYPSVFEMKDYQGDGNFKYEITALLKDGSIQHKQVEKAMADAAKDKWGAKADALLADLKKKDKVCLRDAPASELYDEGLMVKATSKVRPLVLDSDKSPLVEEDGKIYGGCLVNVVLDIYAQDNSFGKRINASLMGVQYAGEGTRFGGARPASADDFDEIEDDLEALIA